MSGTWREHSEPSSVGTGSDLRLGEAVTAHRCTERAEEEEEDIIKMMEENNMHRSRESALELGKNCPQLQFSHNV